MKITMYELLELVKDGKAPKEIKYKNFVYGWVQKYKTYTRYDITGKDLYITTNNLNNEVEIIEEDTKLKKINLNYSVPYAIYDMKALRETLEEIIENQRIHEDRINELIDEVNKLKGEK